MPLELPQPCAWISTDALSCAIAPGIGTVDHHGSIQVAPAETTTYTITATGPGGESDPVSVIVIVAQPAPTVTLAALPETIARGQSTTLTWTSTDADSCVIDPGNTAVGCNSFATVTPNNTTTYTITATNAMGSATATAMVIVIVPRSVQITYPADNERINRPDTLVQGSVEGFTGSDIGVTVNGVVAHVYGTEFAANHVPLQEGDNNSITAFAVNDSGDNATDAINVRASTAGNHITLTGSPSSGITPLEFTMNLTKTYAGTTYAFSYTGPGAVDNMGDNATIMEFKRRVAEPGLYYITAEDNETLDNGTQILHTDTMAIMADNRTALDAKLKEKWEGMKAALSQSNINNAISWFDNSTKEGYTEAFTALFSQLPQIAQDLSNIQLLDMQNSKAQYDIRIFRSGNEFSYYLVFVKDKNGIWKIKAF